MTAKNIPKRRADRYSNDENSELVLGYMLNRIDDVARVFKVPGFHRERFKAEMGNLASKKSSELQEALFELCSHYDKSEQSEFDSLKARLRRYIYSTKNCTTIIVTSQTAAKFNAYKKENGIESNDEALSSLISFQAIQLMDGNINVISVDEIESLQNEPSYSGATLEELE